MLSKSEDFELAFLTEKLARRLARDENSVPDSDPDFVRAQSLLERSILFGRESAEPRQFQGLSPRLNK